MKKLFFRSVFIAAATIAVMVGNSVVSAAVLTTVPMQGGMAMPMVSYQAADGRIHITMPVDLPQLTPLLISNPADSFDPADPWFDALDPCRRGASFSRRYGFVMDAMSDPLPAGMQIWIRKLSGPSDLKFYRYSGSAPKLFDPVFGTDGSTNALYWNGMMFHPAVAAPSGTNNYSAIFEVLLVDSVSGQEVSNSSSGPLTFDWTNVPDGRPALALAQKMMVAWPSATATNWILESAASVDAVAWNAVTNTTVIINGEPCVILAFSGTQQFFRMRYVP